MLITRCVFHTLLQSRCNHVIVYVPDYRYICRFALSARRTTTGPEETHRGGRRQTRHSQTVTRDAACGRVPGMYQECRKWCQKIKMQSGRTSGRVSKSQTRTGHTREGREPEPTHNELKHTITRKTAAHERNQTHLTFTRTHTPLPPHIRSPPTLFHHYWTLEHIR